MEQEKGDVLADNTDMVFAKSLDKLEVLEREYHEWANCANFPESVRVIRTLA